MNECDCGKIISSNRMRCRDCNEINEMLEGYYLEVEESSE